jgi:hypothetical protein
MNNFRTSTRNSVQERNKKALAIFNQNGFDVRLSGDDESPMFIFEDSILLSCFLNGSKLVFRSSPDSANVIHSVNLASDSYITSRELNEILERCEHLPLHRIQDNNSGLYLVGFNYLKDEEGQNASRFPVFAKHKPFVYVHRGKAEEIADELKNVHYNVQVI